MAPRWRKISCALYVKLQPSDLTVTIERFRLQSAGVELESRIQK